MRQLCPTCHWLNFEDTKGIACVLHKNPDPVKYYCHCADTDISKEEHVDYDKIYASFYFRKKLGEAIDREEKINELEKRIDALKLIVNNITDEEYFEKLTNILNDADQIT